MAVAVAAQKAIGVRVPQQSSTLFSPCSFSCTVKVLQPGEEILGLGAACGRKPSRLPSILGRF